MKNKLIAAALDFQDKFGRFPKNADWVRRKGFPCGALSVSHLFGNWSKFRIACGVQPTNRRAYIDIELRQLVIDATQTFIQLNKRFPTTSELQMKYGFPCCFKTSISLFGSVDNFKQACGWFDRYTVETEMDMLEWIKLNCQIDDCWNWHRSKDVSGYGTTRWHKQVWKVHRLVYTLIHGVISPKLVIRHRCHNKQCCNPDHLEIGSQQENIVDSLSFRQKAQRKVIYKPKGLIGYDLVDWLNTIVERKKNGCWKYPGVTVNGYSTFCYNKKSYFLHRYVCAIIHGLDYKDDFIARHMCHNKWCVNPAHLIPGSRRENAIDSRSKNSRYKITEDIVSLIKIDWKQKSLRPMEFCKKWAMVTKTTPHAIFKIIHGQSWSDVTID